MIGIIVHGIVLCFAVNLFALWRRGHSVYESKVDKKSGGQIYAPAKLYGLNTLLASTGLIVYSSFHIWVNLIQLVFPDAVPLH
jgi:hypothetical protein